MNATSLLVLCFSMAVTAVSMASVSISSFISSPFCITRHLLTTDLLHTTSRGYVKFFLMSASAVPDAILISTRFWSLQLLPRQRPEYPDTPQFTHKEFAHIWDSQIALSAIIEIFADNHLDQAHNRHSFNMFALAFLHHAISRHSQDNRPVNIALELESACAGLPEKAANLLSLDQCQRLSKFLEERPTHPAHRRLSRLSDEVFSAYVKELIGAGTEQPRGKRRSLFK